MITKIVEVIALILDNLNKDYTLEEVNKLLDNKEYDRQTVSAAFSLLFDKVLSSKIKKSDKKGIKPAAFRVLSNEEIDLIGIDNYNYLLNLINLGLINSMDIELILEHANGLNGRVLSKDDINWIVFISLIDLNAGLLPGSRVLLYSSDTIN